jgi:hypothetical protein
MFDEDVILNIPTAGFAPIFAGGLTPNITEIIPIRFRIGRNSKAQLMWISDREKEVEP